MPWPLTDNLNQWWVSLLIFVWLRLEWAISGMLPWWRHQMETFSALLALCEGNRWIPLTKPSNAELWCVLWSAPEQTDEQTIETLVIWDTIVLIIHYNECFVMNTRIHQYNLMHPGSHHFIEIRILMSYVVIYLVIMMHIWRHVISFLSKMMLCWCLLLPWMNSELVRYFIRWNYTDFNFYLMSLYLLNLYIVGMY